MPRSPHGCNIGLEDLPYEELLNHARELERERDEARERISAALQQLTIPDQITSGISEGYMLILVERLLRGGA